MSETTYRLRDEDWQWVPEGAALRASDGSAGTLLRRRSAMVHTTAGRIECWGASGPALDLTRPTGICAAVEVVRGRTGDDTWHLRPDLKGSVVMESLDEDGVGCAMIDASGEWVEGKGEAACALAALKATEGEDHG